MLQVVFVSPIVCWWKEHSILEESAFESPICHETKNGRDERGKDSSFVVVDQNCSEVGVSDREIEREGGSQAVLGKFRESVQKNHQLQFVNSRDRDAYL